MIDLYAMDQGKWDPTRFCHVAQEAGATLSSLVPAQVYDLVQRGLSPPKTLRAIMVGGGAIHAELQSQAQKLGWPLLASYGLTECASSVALACASSPADMMLLPHVEAELNSKGLLRLKSAALLTLYALQTSEGIRYHDPKVEGWFTTEDRGEIQKGILKVLGRSAHGIKIGGEKVDLLALERALEEVGLNRKLTLDMALVPVPDERLEYVIHLAVTTTDVILIEEVIRLFNQRVMPYEKIRAWHALSHIPRTPLFKIKMDELRDLIQVSR